MLYYCDPAQWKTDTMFNEILTHGYIRALSPMKTLQDWVAVQAGSEALENYSQSSLKDATNGSFPFPSSLYIV